jgi:hypothetical protein
MFFLIYKNIFSDLFADISSGMKKKSLYILYF